MQLGLNTHNGLFILVLKPSKCYRFYSSLILLIIMPMNQRLMCILVVFYPRLKKIQCAQNETTFEEFK